MDLKDSSSYNRGQQDDDDDKLLCKIAPDNITIDIDVNKMINYYVK